jgi:hypothetical protein
MSYIITALPNYITMLRSCKVNQHMSAPDRQKNTARREAELRMETGPTGYLQHLRVVQVASPTAELAIKQIKISNYGSQYGLDSSVIREAHLAGFCENGDEHLAPFKIAKFFLNCKAISFLSC